jgi:hypothetical protein
MASDAKLSHNWCQLTAVQMRCKVKLYGWQQEGDIGGGVRCEAGFPMKSHGKLQQQGDVTQGEDMQLPRDGIPGTMLVLRNDQNAAKGRVKNGGADKAIVLCGTKKTFPCCWVARSLSGDDGRDGWDGWCVAENELAGCTHPRERP